MATKRDLLKEAIADAKAVKETAIANAKAALEEAFTPQLKSMFAAKLHEMEDMDEMEEKETMDEMEDMDEMKDKDMMEVDLEELLAELNEEDEVEENLYEAEESEEEESEEEEGEPLDLEDMTDEDLKKMIEDVIADMIEAGELEAGEGGEEEEGEEEEMSDEEEVDLAELLREIEEMENDKVYEEEQVDEVFGFLQKLFAKSDFSSVLKPFLSQNEKEIAAITAMEAGSDERIGKANELLNKFEAFARTAKYGDEGVKRSDRSSLMLLLKGKGLGGKTSGELTPDISGLKEELDEAYSTIESLKNELNEINLLNAKLLYSNKIFKSKNLNESQKVKVLSSFDKANTVGEVKMVFETLNEGIKVTKNMIKENLGSASKSTVTPTVKKPIVESNDAFLRMQKLAGLI